MKKIKIPPCTKRVSGKHSWVPKIPETGVWPWSKTEWVKIQPVCIYCGLIDDREENDEKD